MLGADDFLYKDCLAVQSTLFLEGDKENAIAVVCCRRDVIDAKEKADDATADTAGLIRKSRL